MSNDWLKEEHVEFLKNLIPHLEKRADQRRAREVLHGLTMQLTTRLASEAGDAVMADLEVPLTEQDLNDVNALVGKGVLHNGLVPELSGVQVLRALRVFSELMQRTAAGPLDLDDQAGLDWVFDVAADAHNGENRGNVRRLEDRVRASLGLERRLTSYIPINEHNPA